MNKKGLLKLAAAFLISLAAAVTGSIPITLLNGVAWQDTLNKPFFAPPNWLFGPAWTVLFILMAIALYLVWTKWPAKDAKLGLALYGVQIVLNVLWNFIFFGARLILPGLIELMILLVFIAATTFVFYRVDKRAAYLMVPYLLWVSFATCLNGAIWLLNP